MRAALCADCGAVLGTCGACGELAECGYCALGMDPPAAPRRALARRTGRVYTPSVRKRRAEPEPARSLLERTTGLTGDHVAAIAASAIVGALARGGIPSDRPGGRGYHVVEGDYREVP